MLWLLACTDADVADTSHESTGSGRDTAANDTGDDPGANDFDPSGIAKAVESDLAASMASGAQVAIWHDGEIVYSGAFGSRHPDTDDPLATSTLFQVGSDTKKMTAAALLQAESRGEIGLDAGIAALGFDLATSPSWAAGATIRDLLSHQGGLYDYTPWSDHPDDSYLSEHGHGDFASREWAHAPAGAMWNYSNANFSLAGLLHEEHDGRPWGDILEDDLLAPLGMTRSYARKAEVEADGDYATGYGLLLGDYDGFDPWADVPYEIGVVEMAAEADNAFTRPAGLVWSTAEQVVRYGAFLIDGDDAVLDTAAHDQLTTPMVRLYPQLDSQHYALGLMVLDGFQVGRKYYETPLWVHGGNTMAFSSAFYVLPEQRVAISVLSNGYGDDFGSTVMAAIKALDVLPEAGEATWPTAETDHAALVGTYVEPVLGEVVVTDADGVLSVSIPGLVDRGYEVAPELIYGGITDLYYVEIDDYPWEFSFIQDDSGTYRYVRDRKFVATRQETLAATRPGTGAVHSPGGLSPAMVDNFLSRPPWPVAGSHH
ncbi:MAG: beta-lactamase family protein [Deltaproteobacteria bacterium]|nr:beta-lactamase family protein [Deltaproteobacteria bacterium]